MTSTLKNIIQSIKRGQNMRKTNIKATRMELLSTKKKSVLAQRGHKLLKNKQDQLMQSFLKLIEEAKGKRKEVEERIKEVYKEFISAKAVMGKEEIDYALSSSLKEGRLEVETKTIAGVRLPKFKYTPPPFKLRYSLLTTSPQLDKALLMLSKLIKELVELAEFEISILRLGKE
ncbi:MAG TPA: V-type ATP synthase subunit D, partial [Thermoplasmata archaeon]|nr:V-type ATP synthase subunit D [Thermoplasmata archaeon]